jgi:hypothetical protein
MKLQYLCIIHRKPIGSYAGLLLEIALKCIRNILERAIKKVQVAM